MVKAEEAVAVDVTKEKARRPGRDARHPARDAAASRSWGS
jgi:hypothetical protein